MAAVRVAYWWSDGSHLDAQAWADDTSPVAMAIARVTAVEALFEGMDLWDERLEPADDDDVLFPPEGEQ